jgi:hypothetical protein
VLNEMITALNLFINYTPTGARLIMEFDPWGGPILTCTWKSEQREGAGALWHLPRVIH